MATQTSAASTPHATTARLEDLAATAALYVTQRGRNQGSEGDRFMDGDRLSSAGAAASLKYANPEDLPSFPSTGLRKGDTAAGAAASIGWANQRSFEHWKPGPSSSASQAAMVAKDYKTPPPWQPVQSNSGARAAVLAVKDGTRVEIWKPEASVWGNSAANQAFKNERRGGLSQKIDFGHAAIGRQGSLLAAAGAMSGTRKRSDSTPVRKPTYPDEVNAMANALSAATHANNPRKSTMDYSLASGASPFTNMPKEMFTSHPPVASEVDEKRRSDILHASAIAMAKQMYNLQQRQTGQTANAQRSPGQVAAVSAHGRQLSSSNKTDEPPPMRLTSLQEAAKKLAQERLAKLDNEHARNREYRDYYGEDSRPKAKLSIRGRVRHRASSDGTLDEDRERSQRIRAQMSLFSSNLSQVDAKKRQKDREALMAVAQRNVRASLHGMDERVFKETGKVSPSMLNEWEVKAHAAAQKKSDSRMENYGKVNIGGGKFVDQSIIDVAAARNVQPVLDEINAKAEKERIHQAEIKLDQEASKRSAEARKTHEKEVKEINRRLKEQDREEDRLRKEEEKAAKAEQKRIAKQETRKSKEATAVDRTIEIVPKVVATEDENAASPGDAHGIVVIGEPITEESMAVESVIEEISVDQPADAKPTHTIDTTPKPGDYIASAGLRTSMEMQTEDRLIEIIKEGEKSPTSPDSPKGVKGWLKTKFQRHSKTRKSGLEEGGADKPLVGSTTVAETGHTSIENNVTFAEDFVPRKSSIEEVALAGPSATRGEPVETANNERAGRSKRRMSSVGSVPSLERSHDVGKGIVRDDDFDEARDHFDNDLAPPSTLPITKSASPIRDSKFHEEI